MPKEDEGASVIWDPFTEDNIRRQEIVQIEQLAWSSQTKNFQLNWLGLDALSLIGPTGVQLLDFCCSSVSVLVLPLSTHLVSSQCCFDASMS